MNDAQSYLIETIKKLDKKKNTRKGVDMYGTNINK